MGKILVPKIVEVGNSCFFLFEVNVAMLEAALAEDAKPHLDKIEPGPVKGGKVDNNAFVGVLQPFPAQFSRLEGGIGDIAEGGDLLAEAVIEVCVKIVHDVVQRDIWWLALYVFDKDFNKSLGGVVVRAAGEDLTGLWPQKCQDVNGSVAFVFEFAKASMTRARFQVRSYGQGDLEAWTFIKAKEEFGRVEVNINNVFHLLEKIRIADVQEVAFGMWLQRVRAKDALDGAPAHCLNALFRVDFEPLLRPPKRPFVGVFALAVAHRRNMGFLAIKGNRAQLLVFSVNKRTACAGSIKKARDTGKGALPPAAHSAWVALQKPGDTSKRNAHLD